MDKTVKWEHKCLLHQIKGNRAQHNMGGTWMKPVEGEVREAEGAQLEATYIGRRKGIVAQWVALRPILKLCTRDKGYKGRARMRES